jgi:hypothetical protein
MEAEEQSRSNEQDRLESSEMSKLLRQRKTYRRSGWICIILMFVVGGISGGSSVFLDFLTVGLLIK